jgi:SNF2 family DNA or RNA helicase
VSGVDFLWKALTNSSTQGAILADEMGLGYVDIVL